MEKVKMSRSDFVTLLKCFSCDARLGVWHLALLSAILILGLQQGKKQKIKVSRSKLMVYSRISTIPTFHKYFKNLQEIGIIIYRPSYHPGFRSEIDIKGNPA